MNKLIHFLRYGRIENLDDRIARLRLVRATVIHHCEIEVGRIDEYLADLEAEKTGRSDLYNLERT